MVLRVHEIPKLGAEALLLSQIVSGARNLGALGSFGPRDGNIRLGPGVLGSGRLKASKRQRSSRGHVLVAHIREAGIRGAGVLETEAGELNLGGGRQSSGKRGARFLRPGE